MLNALSSYDLTHSKLYRLYPEETEATAVRAFNLLSDYYGKHRRSGICERFFGKVYESPYVMFRSAVFTGRKSTLIPNIRWILSMFISAVRATG